MDEKEYILRKLFKKILDSDESRKMGANILNLQM